jgi:tetratricopeptide (TPR) repeat protein
MRVRASLILPAAVLMIAGGLIAFAFYQGNADLRGAESAMAEARYPDADRLYESAARRLFWRSDLWERAGVAAFRANDKDDAIRLLETARQKNALSAQGWDALGLAYWVKDDHASAFSIWSTGSQAHPSYAPLYDHLALADHERGDYAAEQDALTKRLALADDAAARYRLGLLLALSDPQRAQREFAAASSLDPEFDSVVLTLQTALNMALLEPDFARREVTLGRGLGLVEEWDLAERAFEAAVGADGKNAEAWAWLGEARQHKGANGSAELDKAVSLDPRDTLVRALRGLYWKRQGKYTQALAEYVQAAQIEPDNPTWQASIGEAYTQTGDLVSALVAYQKATDLAPTDATYWRLLAMFCSNNGVQVQEIGLPAAQKAAELAPNDAQVLDALGWSYLNAGYPNTAEQTLLRAIQSVPDFALAHVHLAETYLRQGDQASAFNELSLARQLDQSGPVGELASRLLKQYFP